jgi:hypothetical protein
MPSLATPLPLDTVTRIRRQYADGVPLARICAEHRLSKRIINKCVAGNLLGLGPLPPTPFHRSDTSSPPPDRRGVVEQLWRSAEREVLGIDERLAHLEGRSPEREREMRILPVLVKVVRDLTTLDQAQFQKPASKDTPRDDDDDAVPRDLEELRRELSRRVDLLRQRRLAAGRPGGDAA